MAKRRKKAVRRKNRPSGTKKTKSRRRRKSKMGLSEMISHQGLKRTGKSFVGGALGGSILGVADMLMGDDANELLRFGVSAGLAVVAGGAMDMPNVAAGIGGAWGHSATTKLGQKLLDEMENEEYADQDALSDYPDALDESGTPMYLADDGQFYYLEEFELAESFQDVNMYPQYVNSSRF